MEIITLPIILCGLMLVGMAVIYLLLSIEEAMKILSKVNNQNYPIRRKEKIGFWKKTVYHLPFLGVYLLNKEYPEVNGNYGECAKEAKKQIQETGMLFVQPDEKMSIEKQTLFYLKRLSSFKEYIKDPQEGDSFAAFKVDESGTMCTFVISESSKRKIHYFVPAPSLRIVKEKEYGNLVCSLSLDEYKRLFKTKGYRQFIKMSEPIKKTLQLIELNPKYEEYTETLIAHRETFKKIYVSLEASLITKGEISDNLYEKAITLLQNFTDEMEKMSKELNRAKNEKSVAVDGLLERVLDDEIEFQETHILKKSEKVFSK